MCEFHSDLFRNPSLGKVINRFLMNTYEEKNIQVKTYPSAQDLQIDKIKLGWYETYCDLLK